MENPGSGYDIYLKFWNLDKKEKRKAFHPIFYDMKYYEYWSVDNWFKELIINGLDLWVNEKLVIEYKKVDGENHLIANKYYIKPMQEDIFKDQVFSVTSLMELIFWNTGEAINNLKERLHIKNKKNIYKIIGDAYGNSHETIRKQLSGTAKSINAEFILFLEQEFNVHRDEILGPIRIKKYQNLLDFFNNDDDEDIYSFPNFDDVYRNFDFILAKDKEIEEELREMLNLLIKRLKKFLPHQKTKEEEQSDLTIKLSQEIAKITEYLSSEN
jgi:hypothetical protein